MITAYVALGTNLGDKRRNLDRAQAQIDRLEGTRLIRCSRTLETTPLGNMAQPAYLNRVIELSTRRSPEQLLQALKRIEANLGRQRTITWGPRVIDLDILLYGDLRIQSPDLTIPHPGVIDRDFLLRLLIELCPTKIHPVTHTSIFQLFQQQAQ